MFRNTADEFLKIQVDGEAETIQVTLGHPFYVHRNRSNLSSNSDGDGDWVLSKSLRVGDLLKNKTGKWKSILSIERFAETKATYNFEVQHNHDYFVGSNGWLVHNQSVTQAIESLAAKGINPSLTQTSIDPVHVNNIANSMREGTFVQSTGFRNSVIQDVNGTILSGHHRTIASEMTGFRLDVRIVNSNAPAGVWSDIPLIPGRRTP